MSRPGRGGAGLRAVAPLAVGVVAGARVSPSRGCALAWAAGRGVSGQRLVSRECGAGGVASRTGQSHGRVGAPVGAPAAPVASRHAQGDAGGRVDRPGAVAPAAVADDAGRGVASGEAGAPGDLLSALWRPAPAGDGVGSRSGRRLGGARGSLAGAAAPPGGPPGGGLGRGATGTVGGGDRSPPDRGRAVWGWATEVDGVGLPGPERRGLAMAAHPPDRPRTGRAPLGGGGGGHLMGAGRWHPQGRGPDAGRAARPLTHTTPAAACRPPPPQCLSPRLAGVRPPTPPGPAVAQLVAAPRALASAPLASPGDVWPAMTPRLPTLVSRFGGGVAYIAQTDQ